MVDMDKISEKTTGIVDRLRTLITEPKSELNFTNNLELLIAVMLSAQCTDKRVNIITEKLFKKFTTAKDYAGLSYDELAEEIKSCNYYQNKAKNIVETAKILVEKFNGDVPCSHEDLVSLPGVGNKTANVVQAVGFGIPAFAVDTHILRVSNRLGLVETDSPDKCEEKLKLLFNKEDWGEIHHLILLFGRYYCTARNPKCETCVLRDFCHETTL
ncbi:MAG: endonuclease III [Clostridiales bacterium]|nr:endonuclease III [Clostridiales bacterium]